MIHPYFAAGRIRIQAHRGDSVNFPENTFEAFKSAVEMGADVIETDAWLSLDGVVILSHDNSLERNCGDARTITDCEFNELKEVNAGYHFSRDDGQSFPYRQYPVSLLTLEKALQCFPETRFNIDLKSSNPLLAEACVRLIRRYRAEKRILIASFYHKNLTYFRFLMPEVATSASPREIRFLKIMEWTKLTFLKHHFPFQTIQIPEIQGNTRVLSHRLIHWMHKNRIGIDIWTVNSLDEMNRLFDMGVDSVFTDHPSLLLSGESVL